MKQFITSQLKRGQIKDYNLQVNEDIYTLQIGKTIRVYFKVRVQPNYLDNSYFPIDWKYIKTLEHLIDMHLEYDIQGFYCFSIERQKYLYPLCGIPNIECIASPNGKIYQLGCKKDLLKTILMPYGIA